MTFFHLPLNLFHDKLANIASVVSFRKFFICLGLNYFKYFRKSLLLFKRRVLIYTGCIPRDKPSTRKRHALPNDTNVRHDGERSTETRHLLILFLEQKLPFKRFLIPIPQVLGCQPVLYVSCTSVLQFMEA